MFSIVILLSAKSSADETSFPKMSVVLKAITGVSAAVSAVPFAARERRETASIRNAVTNFFMS